MCNPNVLRRDDPRTAIAHYYHHGDGRKGERAKADSSPDLGKKKKPVPSGTAWGRE